MSSDENGVFHGPDGHRFHGSVTVSERGQVIRRTWHLWAVAIVMLGLYAGGARDFLLILIGDTGYMRGQFGSEGVEYFTGYPLACRIIWAINIFGGILAPVLLLARTRWALPAAMTSAAAQVVLLAVTFTLLDRWSALGASTSWFDIGVGIGTLLFAGYCW